MVQYNAERMIAFDIKMFHYSGRYVVVIRIGERANIHLGGQTKFCPNGEHKLFVTRPRQGEKNNNELFSPQHKHWPTGPAHFSDRRASTLYLSLALQDHRVKCRASRLKITVARSMTNFATFSCILFLKFRYVCIA